jgi:hypothetical protein
MHSQLRGGLGEPQGCRTLSTGNTRREARSAQTSQHLDELSRIPIFPRLTWGSLGVGLGNHRGNSGLPTMGQCRNEYLD